MFFLNYTVTRPSLGCRTIVARHVINIFPGVIHDITDWVILNRQKSAQLMYGLILNCEDKATMHVEPVLQSMMKACLDESPIVVKYVRAYYLISSN